LHRPVELAPFSMHYDASQEFRTSGLIVLDAFPNAAITL